MAGNHGKSWPRSQLPLHRRSLWRCRLSKKCNEEFTASPYKTPENQALAVKKSSSNFALRKSALILGTRLETRPRYTPSTSFETFPFPQPTLDQEFAIAAAARELDDIRCRWLNPPESTKTEVLQFPGSVDGPWARYVVEPDARGIGTVRWPRVVPKDADCAAVLKTRTLTNLYNERPAWLDLAHKKLDEAVFAAYGWDPGLSDDALLQRLLDLNLQRAERQGEEEKVAAS